MRERATISQNDQRRKMDKSKLSKMLRTMQVTMGKINAELPRSIRMSPGKRPSHFGARPVHRTIPANAMTAPIITKNFPISRIGQSFFDNPVERNCISALPLRTAAVRRVRELR